MPKMLLRSGRIYDPELPRKLRNFKSVGNPRFREMWDEMAKVLNEHFRATGYDKQKEIELFKALNAKIREILIMEEDYYDYYDYNK
jgi:hypothetical protein